MALVMRFTVVPHLHSIQVFLGQFPPHVVVVGAAAGAPARAAGGAGASFLAAKTPGAPFLPGKGCKCCISRNACFATSKPRSETATDAASTRLATAATASASINMHAPFGKSRPERMPSQRLSRVWSRIYFFAGEEIVCMDACSAKIHLRPRTVQHTTSYVRHRVTSIAHKWRRRMHLFTL